MTDKLKGTFACPLCGLDKPHHHSPEQVAAYREDQVRDDGWRSCAYSLPTKEGFYLIRGHRLQQPKDDVYNVNYNLYQRINERDGYPAEVAEWGVGWGQNFTLLHWCGNARIDGAEGRRPVSISPTHWRDLPLFNKSAVKVYRASVEAAANGTVQP